MPVKLLEQYANWFSAPSLILLFKWYFEGNYKIEDCRVFCVSASGQMEKGRDVERKMMTQLVSPIFKI
jgi:hypothetical protein